MNLGDGMYAIGFREVGYILYSIICDFFIQIDFYLDIFNIYIQFNLSLENSEETGSEITILTGNTVMAGGVITMK